MKRRTFSQEFKLDAVNLILKQGYTYREAQDATGASNAALRNWVNQVNKEQHGETPVGAKAITDEQRKVQKLEARIKQLEIEKEILKKATVDSSGHCNSFTTILICRSIFDETTKANVYSRREGLSI
ncbi:transposase [Pleionea mediterranea]|uniref:Transposase n=1 Tax=Pleionea mediterranea TaxID=523701 RepID=A0A316G0J9_9GAMM|nr:transposase [Pleionea mediterranea]PWK54369.1 transposase [Pleionea mediterranea]